MTDVDSTIRRLFVARETGRMPPGLTDDILGLLHERKGAPDTMRQREAAQFLGVSARTLRNWKSSADGPPHQRVGRIAIYSREALECWLRSSKSGA